LKERFRGWKIVLFLSMSSNGSEVQCPRSTGACTSGKASGTIPKQSESESLLPFTFEQDDGREQYNLLQYSNCTVNAQM
jgi:hypothetical protein